jgi:hypothetical protein
MTRIDGTDRAEEEDEEDTMRTVGLGILKKV